MGNGVRIPTATEITQLLADWSEWVAARTDSLLSLESRVRTAGTADDEADVAAAFVCRKAITDRLQTVTELSQHDRAAATALSAQPLRDDLGQLVGNSLVEAATLLDAVLQRVEGSVEDREREQVLTVTATAAAQADLTIAARLAQELGMQANQVAELRERLGGGGDLTEVAGEAATVRISLEAAAKERDRLLEQWNDVPARLAALTATEGAVRELAERCRAKVLQAPPLAVPSVATVGADLPDVAGLTWIATRGRITPVLHQVDRVAAALAEAQRRFQAALDRREELRGLVQAFADKASVGGVLEHPELDTLYQEAKAVLWSAPCDIDRGGELVDRYVALVNTKVKEVAR
ncbi:MAG TPA: hypothetical protein PLP26_02490 [Ilumatobacteraceae bacterium]|nr:hypothetical protein [Ilumatobacteraceae bacterium]